MIIFLRWLFSGDWHFGVSFREYKEAVIWAKAFMAADLVTQSRMIDAHNKECIERRINS